MIFVRALALLLALSGSALAQSGQMPSGTVWGNPGASKAIATSATVTAILDRALGSVRGSIIERGASGWALIGPGATVGLPFVSNGAGADPGYTSSLSMPNITATTALGSPTITATTSVNSPTYNASAQTAFIGSAINTGMELGNQSSANTPFIDFHSSGNVIDFDVRMIASGGTGVAGNGVLTITAATVQAPTPATSDSSTRVATTAYVQANTALKPPQGRLTLQTATPVMTTTQSAKTTIYYTAYVGSLIPTYDGTNMVPSTITGGEISVLTTDTTKSAAAIGASKVNDWFVWSDSGTIRIGHGPDWTSDTARSAGTALVMVNGILLNNASITNGPAASRGTYVGTTRSNASSQLDWILGAGAAGGTAAFLGVWNAYNRVAVTTTVTDTNASWISTTSAAAAALDTGGTGSGLNNRISAVFGLAEDGAAVSVFARISPGVGLNDFGRLGLALNSTASFDKGALVANTGAIAWSGVGVHVSAGYAPQLGFNFWQALQAGDGTNTATFVGGAEEGLTAALRM